MAQPSFAGTLAWRRRRHDHVNRLFVECVSCVSMFDKVADMPLIFEKKSPMKPALSRKLSESLRLKIRC